MEKYYIGIDVGATNVRIGLVDDHLNILVDKSYKSSEVSKDFAKCIKDFINDLDKKYQVRAISIGFPGLVNQEKRLVVNIPNQKSFEGSYLKDLEEELNIPIIIDNDVNYLMLFDALYFNIDPNQSILGFYLGTGFGNAIRINDRLYQGQTGAAGEIGHIPIYENFDINKSKQDHLETIVSGYQLINIHQKYFKDTPFEQLFIKHFKEEPIQKYLHYLAFAIASEMIVLDISTIILGGGVIMSDQFPKKYLEDIIKRHLRSDLARENFQVFYAKPDAKSGILGAIIYAKNYLKKL